MWPQAVFGYFPGMTSPTNWPVGADVIAGAG